MSPIDKQARAWRRMAVDYLEQYFPDAELEVATEEYTDSDCPLHFIQFKLEHNQRRASEVIHYTQSDSDMLDLLERLAEGITT